MNTTTELNSTLQHAIQVESEKIWLVEQHINITADHIKNKNENKALRELNLAIEKSNEFTMQPDLAAKFYNIARKLNDAEIYNGQSIVCILRAIALEHPEHEKDIDLYCCYLYNMLGSYYPGCNYIKFDNREIIDKLILESLAAFQQNKKIYLLIHAIEKKHCTFVKSVLDRYSDKIDINRSIRRFEIFIENFATTLLIAAYQADNSQLIKYLLLLGSAIDSLRPWNNRYDLIRKCNESLTNNLSKIVSTIVNNRQLLFFQELPPEIKMAIAIKTLKQNDPDLTEIPDKILIEAISNECKKVQPLSKKSKGIAILAIREFRDAYPARFSKSETKDKQRLLKNILYERFGSHMHNLAERFWLYHGFRKLGTENKYPNRDGMEKVVDSIFEIELRIQAIVSDACSIFQDKHGIAINQFEQGYLSETISSVLAYNCVDVQWDTLNTKEFAIQIAALLEPRLNYSQSEKLQIPPIDEATLFKDVGRKIGVTEKNIRELIQLILSEDTRPQKKVRL